MGNSPNLPQLSDDEIEGDELRRIIEQAEVTRTPPPSWHRTMGNNPEVAVAFANYWEILHRGGLVEHDIKELARLQIAQMVGCEFCARQISPLSDIPEEVRDACALPNWEHPNPRTRAALHYARTLTLDDGRDSEVYDELHEHFTNAEIVELAAFFCLTMGGNRMAKSWAIEPHVGDVIPEGVMSIHQ